jgi:hypothetical protein
MIRRRFTLVSAASLLLCAATAVLWVRSYFAVEIFTYTGWGEWPEEHRLIASRGLLRFDVLVHPGVSS